MNWKLTWTLVALIIVTTGVIVFALLSTRERNMPQAYMGWRVEMWNILHGYRVELCFENNVILGRSTLRSYIAENYPVEIDPSISREHCMLFEQDEMLLAWNMSAVNPMSINGYRMNSPVCLHAGDRIEMGSSTFLVTRVERMEL